ncbi:hypothetical protein HYH03_013020 [Edaphochlamys debaryana]|uniref:Uncharacterized protein n=1 Tax=Edaphochlamys debaryana TaxID=47281 RepID=A0A836BTX3_9CHLO|nr:hypothetical protein HYH03_013020 [Edaphochlamys debaryana]|eukprot:KAG2488517.1 hypothetical protein HYH03_013020 [Edaphochlamys debaryana]
MVPWLGRPEALPPPPGVWFRGLGDQRPCRRRRGDGSVAWAARGPAAAAGVMVPWLGRPEALPPPPGSIVQQQAAVSARDAAAAAEEAARLTAEITVLKSSLQDGEAHCSALQASVDDARAFAANLQQQLVAAKDLGAQWEQELAEATARLQETDAQVQTLTVANAELDAEADDLGIKLKDMEVLYKDQCNEHVACQAQLYSANDQAAEAEKMIESMTLRLEEMHRVAAKTATEAAGKIKVLEASLQVQVARCSELQASLNEAKATAATRQTAAAVVQEQELTVLRQVLPAAPPPVPPSADAEGVGPGSPSGAAAAAEPEPGAGMSSGAAAGAAGPSSYPLSPGLTDWGASSGPSSGASSTTSSAVEAEAAAGPEEPEVSSGSQRSPTLRALGLGEPGALRDRTNTQNCATPASAKRKQARNSQQMTFR